MENKSLINYLCKKLILVFCLTLTVSSISNAGAYEKNIATITRNFFVAAVDAVYNYHNRFSENEVKSIGELQLNYLGEKFSPGHSEFIVRTNLVECDVIVISEYNDPETNVPYSKPKLVVRPVQCKYIRQNFWEFAPYSKFKEILDASVENAKPIKGIFQVGNGLRVELDLDNILSEK